MLCRVEQEALAHKDLQTKYYHKRCNRGREAIRGKGVGKDICVFQLHIFKPNYSKWKTIRHGIKGFTENMGFKKGHEVRISRDSVLF